MEAERLNMGWAQENIPDYVLQNYIDDKSRDYCQNLIDTADILVCGSAPYRLIENRLKSGKITFLYSERLYKGNYQYYKMPIRFIRFFKKYTRYKNLYLLCASAYTAADFAKTLTFLNKSYKWGYFPELKIHNNIDALVNAKHPATILWVARFIDWKHPEIPIEIAKRLKSDGYKFELNLIGNGELEERINQMIRDYDLTDCVNMLGSMTPEEVREHMEKSEVFMFTSDRGEGWGAVLNESMNSACAVVASHAIGSVPFLIDDGKNGLIYKDGDIADLYEKVKWLLENGEERKTISKNAYNTMITEWNAENAAKKLLQLSEKFLSGERKPFPFDSGVCSQAELLKDNWYK